MMEFFLNPSGLGLVCVFVGVVLGAVKWITIGEAFFVVVIGAAGIAVGVYWT